MTSSQKWVKYLKNKSLDRLMIELKKKYVSYGRLTGKIIIKDLTSQERKDISGLLGRHLSGEVINAKEVEDAIVQNSIYGQVDIKEIIDAYFNETVLTSKQRKEIKNIENDNFYNLLIQIVNENDYDKRIIEWLDDSYKNKKYGYQIIQNIKKDDRALDIFKSLFNGINKILNEDINMPIAIFSSTISGNPHFLDRNSQSSSLFISILAYLFNEEYPNNITKWYELYQKAGLIKNEIAGNVAIYNVHLLFGNNKYHEGAEYCYKYGETFILSFANLNNINSAMTDNNIVYIVENEMVYSFLQNELKDNNIALICTSGQLSYTALNIIELLVKSNTRMYYSGDIDPEGIGICDRLYQKYPNNIIPWYMDVNSYLRCISNEDVSSSRLSSLDKVENGTLKETSKVLKEKKKAGYQENIIDLYLSEFK